MAHLELTTSVSSPNGRTRHIELPPNARGLPRTVLPKPTI